MGKTRRGHKEIGREQSLKHENHKLRREISSLRKQLARIDLDRHGYIKDIVDEHFAKEEREETTTQMLERLKDVWKCRECGNGYLEINLYSKIGETWYFRQCNSCSKRTKSQRYDSDKVQGPIKNPTK